MEDLGLLAKTITFTQACGGGNVTGHSCDRLCHGGCLTTPNEFFNNFMGSRITLQSLRKSLNNSGTSLLVLLQCFKDHTSYIDKDFMKYGTTLMCSNKTCLGSSKARECRVS